MILMFLAFTGFLFYFYQTNAKSIPVEFVPLIIFVGLVAWWLHYIITKLIKDND